MTKIAKPKIIQRNYGQRERQTPKTQDQIRINLGWKLKDKKPK